MSKINARLALTKFHDTFVGQDGSTVNFDYVEVEFAPNCFCRFKLNTANKRALQKYAPNMFQLLSNIPAGTPVLFEELENKVDVKVSSELESIYKQSESEL